MLLKHLNRENIGKYNAELQRITALITYPLHFAHSLLCHFELDKKSQDFYLDIEQTSF